MDQRLASGAANPQERRISFVKPGGLPKGQSSGSSAVLGSSSGGSSSKGSVAVAKATPPPPPPPPAPKDDTVRGLRPKGPESPQTAALPTLPPCPLTQHHPPAPPAQPQLRPMDAETRALVRWSAAAGPALGLRNLGNTCFMNATLACLASTPTLVQLLRSIPQLPLPGPQQQQQQQKQKQKQKHSHQLRVAIPFDAFAALQQLLTRMHARDSSQGVVVPSALAHNLSRISADLQLGYQEDAHEFLVALLHCMEGGRSLSPERRKAQALVLARCFGGSYRSALTCPSCRHTSTADETWSPLDLQLNVGASVGSVEEALRQWGAAVTLGEGDKWKCGGCSHSVRASKRMTIVQPPATLVITLKRWGARTGGMGAGMLARWKGVHTFRAAKITAHISFPLALDLTPVLFSAPGPGGCTYDLTGVLVHKGSSPHDGHYIAFCKAPGGQWARHDDETVTPVKPADVLAASAYLLFYTRQVPKAGAAAAAGASPSAQAAATVPVPEPAAAAPAPAPAVTAAAMPMSVEDLEAVQWVGGSKAPESLPPSGLVFKSSIPSPPATAASSSSSSSSSAAVAEAAAPASKLKRRRAALPKPLEAGVMSMYDVEGIRGMPFRFQMLGSFAARLNQALPTKAEALPRKPKRAAALGAAMEEEAEAEAEAEAAASRPLPSKRQRVAAAASAPAPTAAMASFKAALHSSGIPSAAAAAAAPAPAPAPAATQQQQQRPTAYTVSSLPPPQPTQRASSQQPEAVLVTGKRRQNADFDPALLAQGRPGLKASPARPQAAAAAAQGAGGGGWGGGAAFSGQGTSFEQPSWEEEEEEVEEKMVEEGGGSSSSSSSSISSKRAAPLPNVWGPAPQLQTHGGPPPPAFAPSASGLSSGSRGGGGSSGSGGFGGPAAPRVGYDEALDLGRVKKVKSKGDGGAQASAAFSGAVNSFAHKALAKQEERKGGHRH